MKRIAINAIYLTSRYEGSGFYTYLFEILKSLNKILAQTIAETITIENEDCQYFLISPEPIDRESLLLTNFETMVVPYHSKIYTSDIVTNPDFLRKGFHILFLPHLELPRPFTTPKSLKIVPLIHDLIPTLFLTPSYLFTLKTPHQLLTRRGIMDYLRVTFRVHWNPRNYPLILTISESSREIFKHIFGRKFADQTEIIGPGRSSIYKKQSLETIQPVLHKYGLDHPNNYLIYFGGFTVRKNYIRLVRAFQLFHEKYAKESDKLKLVLVGAKGNNKLSKLSKLSKLTGLDHTLLLPKLPIHELNALISGATFSIYPSLYEGFGLPLVESIQAGTLPIASKIPTSHEILGSDYPYLFNPYRTEEMARLIAKAINEIHDRKNKSKDIPTLLKVMEERIKSEKFSWDHSAEKLHRLLISL